ncbi:GNAT family N-acetyltransferase [Nocardioides stalactiti]|uniref:GNAT family N-acetyltransferase n=1 Tax=Nocardioides stalactiti TaxID=2755356 RepID=UPI00160364F3|nr:GNAT family N-acetyltransferase [Nocardioides stalactiti]
MSRSSLTPRIARREDAPALAELWSDVLRRADRAEQVADLELVIKGAAASPEQRFVVIDFDGQLAGAVFLRLTTVSPLNLETCVQSIQPRVFDQYRRRGVGRALMEAAVVFAEENGVPHVSTAVPATVRESNRFMARLALAPVATVRLAPTSLVRSRITPAAPPGSGRAAPRVLAARRNQRRVRATRVTVPFPD